MLTLCINGELSEKALEGNLDENNDVIILNYQSSPFRNRTSMETKKWIKEKTIDKYLIFTQFDWLHAHVIIFPFL